MTSPSEPGPKNCDLLIRGGLILTLDDDDHRFDPGAIAVADSRIIAVGPEEEVAAGRRAATTIDAGGCVVMPGLVNAHTHAAMTLFRGLADDLPLMDWLQQHIFPAEQKLTEEWVYWGTLLACAEMILSGTTTFCDMYLFEQKTAQAAADSGMRALVGEVLYDFPSPNYGPIDNGLRYTEDLLQRWQDHPRISVAVEPHAAYTCSPELLQQCGRIARRHGAPLVIHLAENDAEVRQVVERYGKRPVVHLADLGLLGENLIADHCVALDDRDMALLAEHRVQVVHNPESNMKLASGIAPVPQLLERGINVALGTDGCASNNDLDLFGEMGTCAKLHKATTLDPTVLPAATVLRMATRQGARALGLGAEIGALRPGMIADLIVIDFDRPHLTPVYDPVSHLVYAADPADVKHSVIDGRLVMKDREILPFELSEVIQHVRRIAHSIRG